MKTRICIIALISIGLVLGSCNKEEPQPTSAEFTTNIQGDLEPGESFTLYLSDAKGEFLSYFKGDSEESSWDTGYGTNIEVGADSLTIGGYSAAGAYTFSLVATSYGNWGESVAQDVRSIDIQVVASE